MAGSLDILLERSYRSPVKASFAGSLEYIDSLPTRRPFSIKYGLLRRGRDAFVITNALNTPAVSAWRTARALPLANVFSDNSSDFRLYGDNRMWHPAGENRPLIAMEKGAARLVVPELPKFDPSRLKERDYRTWARDVYAKEYWALVNNNARLKFEKSRRLVICLKRQIRREIMHALGVAGKLNLRPPLMRPESRIKC